MDRFETAALLAATADMKEFLDVYHVFYSPVLEVTDVHGAGESIARYFRAGIAFLFIVFFSG